MKIHLFNRKRYILGFLIVPIAISLWLCFELYTPKEITCYSFPLQDKIKIFLSPDIIIQQAGADGTLWGVRGLWVYKSSGGIKLKRMFRAPINDLRLFLADFRSFRALTGSYEFCEIFQLSSGTILIFSGGCVWRSNDNGRNFRLAHKVRRYGPGIGRGVLPQGMTEDKEGNFYYGEYFRNNTRKDEVCVYRSTNDGTKWEIIYRFKPKEIRHIHSVQYDPYGDLLWMTTGDENKECSIMYSTDKGETFSTIGNGNQGWRVVSLIFTEEAVIWGTDSSSRQNWIFRWDRRNHNVERICKVDGPIFYSTVLSDGTMIMGRTVEGGRGEWDAMTSIWVSKNGWQWKRMPIGVRKRPKKYAVLRLPRGKSTADIYVTPLNVNRYEQILLNIPAIGISKQRSE